jgi:hypothetical protein
MSAAAAAQHETHCDPLFRAPAAFAAPACSSEDGAPADDGADSGDLPPERVFSGAWDMPERILDNARRVASPEKLITNPRTLTGPDFETKKAALIEELTAKGWVKSEEIVDTLSKRSDVLSLEMGGEAVQRIAFWAGSERISFSTETSEEVDGETVLASHSMKIAWTPGVTFESEENDIGSTSFRLIPEFLAAAGSIGYRPSELGFTSFEFVSMNKDGKRATGKEIHACLEGLGFAKEPDDPGTFTDFHTMVRTLERPEAGAGNKIEQLVEWEGKDLEKVPHLISVIMSVDRATGVSDTEHILIDDLQIPGQVSNHLEWSGPPGK